jgi:hypothetical protein
MHHDGRKFCQQNRINNHRIYVSTFKFSLHGQQRLIHCAASNDHHFGRAAGHTRLNTLGFQLFDSGKVVCDCSKFQPIAVDLENRKETIPGILSNLQPLPNEKYFPRSKV